MQPYGPVLWRSTEGGKFIPSVGYPQITQK